MTEFRKRLAAAWAAFRGTPAPPAPPAELSDWARRTLRAAAREMDGQPAKPPPGPGRPIRATLADMAEPSKAPALPAGMGAIEALQVPMIYGNGIDDDLPGFKAVLLDQPVWYDGRLYMPGEPITIERRPLAFSCSEIRVEVDDAPGQMAVLGGGPAPHGQRPCTLYLRRPPRARHVDMNHCVFLWNAPVKA